jgi:hypothetical protein
VPTDMIITSLDFAPDGTLYGASFPTHFGGASSLITVDPLTGAIAVRGLISPESIQAIAYVAPAVVPTPSGLVLLGAGGLALLARRRLAPRPAHRVISPQGPPGGRPGSVRSDERISPPP